MILVGNQRGGARDLARHLMKDENEQVVVHELRGFVGVTLEDAFLESHAISRGTRCTQHLFSLSFNPPPDEEVGIDVFEDAVGRAEQRLGLVGQPRAIVFHEKRGRDGSVRRHAHAVWCRIDPEKMRSVQLSFTKRDLNDLGRELYLEHGWQMPRGFARDHGPDPHNFSLAEWQQAKRAKADPETLKALFRDCWAMSDGQAALAQCLRERGLVLARGDRRGVVAVDRDGEVFAISRWVGIKAADVRARVSEPERLPSVRQAHAQAATIVTERLEEISAEQQRIANERAARLEAAKERLRTGQEHQAAELGRCQAKRKSDEESVRAARIRKGWRGLVDMLTGRKRRAEAENAQEAERAERRDIEEQRALAERHRLETERAERTIEETQHESNDILRDLREDIQRLRPPAMDGPVQDAPRKRRTPTAERPRRRRSRTGPSMS